jgi:phenylpyruvate tautomerase PptA (4-oxalocrotonate tautomerase family)
MPMIELTLPEGALDKGAQDELMAELTTTLLRWEGAPEDSEAAKAISWGYVDERPAERVYQAGRPEPAQPTYRVKITVPEGALDAERKSGLVADVTRAVLTAEGSDPEDLAAGMRVWTIIREVTDGNWGGAGRIWTLRDIARAVNGRNAEVDEAISARA